MVATREEGRSPTLPSTRKTQILAAALTWSMGGIALMTSGTLRLARADSNLLGPLLLGATIAGFIKARYVLLPFVRRAVARIRDRNDGSSFFGFFAPKTWLLIVLMIALGRVMSLLSTPQDIRGAVQIAIGGGLLATSVPFWREWQGGREMNER